MEGKPIKNYSTKEILSEDPLVLTEKLKSEYLFYLPETIENADDLLEAGRFLGKIANSYSFLVQLSSLAKINVRKLKREKKSKDEIDNAIDRKDSINNTVEAVKMQYNAISRLITVKQQINEELKMTDGK